MLPFSSNADEIQCAKWVPLAHIAPRSSDVRSSPVETGAFGECGKHRLLSSELFKAN
jgi:hypothetical protein